MECFIEGKEIAPSEFGPVKMAVDKLDRFLNRPPAGFTKAILEKVIKEVVTRKYIPYQELRDEFTEEVVDLLIEKNLFLLRPTNKDTYDIEVPDIPILTAETQPTFIGMEVIVKD